MKGFFSSSEVQKQAPVSIHALPKCGACGLYKGCQSPKMEPFGSGKKKVLIVGEAPGSTEDDLGRPFVGSSGDLLRNALSGIGIKMDRDTLTTNALICRPPNNLTPDAKQISYCYPNLARTIREFSPRVIVTLGRTALVSAIQNYWTGDIGPMEKWVGWKIPLANHWVCPTYHPSFLLRSKSPLLDRIFANHLESAFHIEEDPPELIDMEGIEVVYEDREASKAIRDIDSQGGWVAVDYETNCLKPEYPKARIVSCSISNGKRTVSYPWIGEAIEATSVLLRSDRTRKISSNLKMEERWTLKHLEHRVRNWGWDTMIAAHCLDNRPGICSIKFQALIGLGVPSSAYNTTIEPYLRNHHGHYNRIEEIKLKDLLLYGGRDSLLEHHTAMWQRKEMGYED